MKVNKIIDINISNLKSESGSNVYMFWPLFLVDTHEKCCKIDVDIYK